MKRTVTVLLHNIRSLHNIGSIFRTADGAGVSRVYLTGYTPTPPRKEITKTALGAEDAVPWEYHSDPVELIGGLRKKGIAIVALERTKGAVVFSKFKTTKSACLILGSEVDGVPGPLMKLSDAVVAIPMRGKKESLNVAVAFGIAVYALTA